MPLAEAMRLEALDEHAHVGLLRGLIQTAVMNAEEATCVHAQATRDLQSAAGMLGHASHVHHRALRSASRLQGFEMRLFAKR